MSKRLLRPALLALAVFVVPVLVAVAVAAARGSYGVVAAPSGSSVADAALWRTCQTQPPRRDRELVHRCVRVRGALLHVWRKHGREGELEEEHLLVVAHFRLYVVKLHRLLANLPVGHSVVAVGALVVPPALTSGHPRG